MTAKDDRSWWHMIELGSTMTLEAWDMKYKSNLDWNHAWGAAPANIIPRCLMGIQPLEAGFGKFRIKPQVGSLKWGSLDMPTIKGTIHVDFEFVKDTSFVLNVCIPANTLAKVCLPKLQAEHAQVLVDGLMKNGSIEDNFVVLDDVGSGSHRFERCHKALTHKQVTKRN